MAFDGSVIACLVKEYKEQILNGRIVKIAQPEKNELLLTIKKDGQQKKLLISAEAALPITYLTEENKTSPLTAPAFCMLLRKHILNGQIIGIYQPSMERIIDFHIEHYNEMGDLCQKILTVELMGKHSNIIFRDGDHILDSIKDYRNSIYTEDVSSYEIARRLWDALTSTRGGKLFLANLSFDLLDMFIDASRRSVQKPDLDVESMQRALVRDRMLAGINETLREKVTEQLTEIVGFGEFVPGMYKEEGKEE